MATVPNRPARTPLPSLPRPVQRRFLLPVKPGTLLAFALAAMAGTCPGADSPSPNSPAADAWRTARRLMDLHEHIDFTAEAMARAIRILDRAGVGLAVNLSGGTVTRHDGDPSEFERNKALADRLAPGRFLLYFNLDYSDWDQPDFSDRAVKQVDEAYRLGASGFKEFKRLGLVLRDRSGRLLRVDDPKLDPVWHRCGELGLPISIHVADPRAFWLPFEPSNERWKELKDHRSWWFGDSKVYPPREELLAELDRVIARHPETTFVSVHFANNAEDLDWVDQALDQHANLNADIAARVPEIGRHPPEAVRRLFIKHQDRILFATDFQVYEKLILGSSGDAERPSEDDAVVFFQKHWRWLETHDRDFPHMTPIQGDWTISGIGLPADVLRKIYFDNARQLLVRTLPVPILQARRARSSDEAEDASSGWPARSSTVLDQGSDDGTVHASLETKVRAVWTEDALHLTFRSPYTELTTFDPPQPDMERMGLWERDVVEAFIGSDPDDPNHYTEFEVAPNNMKLDLRLKLPERDFAWSSGFQTHVTVDAGRHIWIATMAIPLKALADSPPRPGTRWRINLFRCDSANHAFLAWRPTLKSTFHVPERFGILEFTE